MSNDPPPPPPRPKPTPENLRAAHVRLTRALAEYEAARWAWLDLCQQCKGNEARDVKKALLREAGVTIDDDAE